MEKLTYTRPQTYIVSCMNTCALLEGSNNPTISGTLPDGTVINGNRTSKDDHDSDQSGDAKKHDAWDSWD